MAFRACLVVTMLLAPLGAAAQTPCGGADLGTVTVKTVRDARTLLLADGRMLRLAALEIPPGETPALKSLEGRPLALQAADGTPDRYGRHVALAIPPDAGQTEQES